MYAFSSIVMFLVILTFVINTLFNKLWTTVIIFGQKTEQRRLTESTYMYQHTLVCFIMRTML